MFTQVRAQEAIINGITAHGVLMGLTFALMFPLGASIMHIFKFKGFVWFHAGWQIFTYILAFVGFGIGIWVAVKTDQVSIPSIPIAIGPS